MLNFIYMKKLLSLFLFITLAGVGCISFSGSGGNDGGVWRSVDQGAHWQQFNAFPTAQAIGSIGGVDILDFTADPQDRLAIYAHTYADGLLYTYDGGATWQRARDLSAGLVTGVSVNSKDKCTVYVSSGPRVYKTTDCSRSYTDIYFETSGNTITEVVNDWFNTNIVYIGMNNGDVLKSLDSGVSWSVLKRFSDYVQKIYISPQDSRTVYIGTRNSGIWKSTDGGANWESLSEKLGQYGGGAGLVDIVGDKTSRDLMLIATQYGILRTRDGGATWEPLKLHTAPGSVLIYSLAVNPGNANHVYYGTASTFYKSLDGGATWVTERLPTSRAATVITVDPEDGNVIYLGGTKIKQE